MNYQQKYESLKNLIYKMSENASKIEDAENENFKHYIKGEKCILESTINFIKFLDELNA